MRAIVNTGPGLLEWRATPMPEPGPGRVRVKTAFCGICATDLAMIDGWDRTGFPSIPGHEWSGVVEALGPGVPRRLLGRPCVAENVLSDGGEVGFEHPGGYGEYLITEADRVHPLPRGFPLAHAALIEPLAVCVHALDRLGPLGSDGRVLVIGDGTIGLLLTALLVSRGASLSLRGGRPFRLALALELGAAEARNHHEERGMPSSASGVFDAVVEASGSPQGLQTALELAADRGRIVVLGDYGDASASFPWNRLLQRETTLIGSNASAGAWPEAVKAAARLPLGRLATHKVAAADFHAGMSLMRNRDPGAIRVLLDWTDPAAPGGKA
jgi:threonine dehydrogenase-like Zn-dependent dehydrogenase